MGIGIALVFWAIVGAVLATIGACVLGGLSFLLTRHVIRGRWPVVAVSCILPFMCLPWGGLVFGFQAIVNETLLRRDAGLGDAWKCPLPNGYAILMIDETDHGWVFNPKTQPGPAIGEQGDAVSGIEHLQLSGTYVLGKRSDRWGVRAGEMSTKASYFIMDTNQGTHLTFATREDFEEAASKAGVTVIHFDAIDGVYRRYRFTWFDWLAVFSSLAPPFAGLVALGVWIMRLRRRGRTIQPAVTH